MKMRSLDYFREVPREDDVVKNIDPGYQEENTSASKDLKYATEEERERLINERILQEFKDEVNIMILRVPGIRRAQINQALPLLEEIQTVTDEETVFAEILKKIGIEGNGKSRYYK